MTNNLSSTCFTSFKRFFPSCCSLFLRWTLEVPICSNILMLDYVFRLNCWCSYFSFQTPELLYKSLAAKLVVGMPFKVCVSSQNGSYFEIFYSVVRSIMTKQILLWTVGPSNSRLNSCERASSSRKHRCCEDPIHLFSLHWRSWKALSDSFLALSLEQYYSWFLMWVPIVVSLSMVLEDAEVN